MNPRLLPGIFFCLAAPAFAQDAELVNRFNDAVREWREIQGPNWVVVPDSTGAHAELVLGAGPAPAAVPVTDAEWTTHAVGALAASRAIHGVDPATLVSDGVTLMPLGSIGSGDKWSIEFHQEFRGLAVDGGDVAVLCDAAGRLLAVQTHALAETSEFEITPVVSAEFAREQSVLAFTKEHGLEPTHVTPPELTIFPFENAGTRRGHLAWRLDVRHEVPGTSPVGRRYWVDARTGFPLRDETNIHFFDAGGTVSTMATPGLRADSATNPETLQPAKYVALSFPFGTFYTDANGAFNVPGVVAPVTTTISYDGKFADVDDSPTGLPYTLTVTLNPGPGNTVLMNPSSLDTVTSQANIFNHIATVRDYVRRITPNDVTADQRFFGHANVNDACNANFNGVSINFFAANTTPAGTSCNNTAFSTVVAHELGHWLNSLYGTGNGGDGMGEGNADVFALYVFDTPLNGEGFFVNGNAVRSGNNTRQYCGDCNSRCYGEVHADGEPWMGAAWKVRVNLNNSLGNVAGDLAADTLFMSWMRGYNQQKILSIIELQWLLLDDPDANLLNGSPHAADIRAGFRAQGFPGYFIDVSGVTAWGDQSCERGSYPVTATARSTQDVATLASVVLRYRIDGGVWRDVPMSPAGADTWSGALPYVASPATVEYLVRATDTAGNTRDSSCSPRSFLVGRVQEFASDGFEFDSSWKHGTLALAGQNPNDDWQRGDPFGFQGTSQGVPWTDPSSPAVGSGAWGNDLGFFNGNGAYQQSVHNFLRSPPFDCSGQSGVKLVFQRWLTVEKSQFDVARILVNGVEVWRNPFGEHVLDDQWRRQIVDISAVADNQPNVIVQFELQSDGGLNLGGWQIDDLRLAQLEAVPRCDAIQRFCAGDGSLATACPCGNTGALGHGCAHSNSAAGAELAGSGTPANDDVVLAASGMPTTAVGLYMQHDALGEQPFHDGVLCAGGTLIRLRTRASIGGASSFPNPVFPQDATLTLAQRGGVVPGSGARRYYAVWYRNASSTFCPPATANVTNGLQVTW